MGLKKVAGETALDLIKSENVQNKAVNLFGMLFPYMGIKKKAVDMYIEEIEKSNLSTDAKMISVLNAKKTLKKLKNQKNIAEIAKNNAKEGTDFSEKSGVDEEWFERFMESSAFVSSEEMQLVWGKILANEFEKPGCTPPNMIRILSEFTKTYAKAFRTLCSMRAVLVTISNKEKVANSEWRNMVVYDGNKEYMDKLGLSFEVLNELETLGVIRFNSLTGYASLNIKEKKVLVCFNDKVIETSIINGDQYPIGNVLFTSAGETLRKITEPYEIEGYEDVIKKYLTSKGIKVAKESSYKVLLFEDKVQVHKENP